MLYNLRAKSIKNNGASYAIYTWSGIECESKQAALDLAVKLAREVEDQWGVSCSTRTIEPSLISDEQLEEERLEHAREKAEFELFCGGYDDVV